MREADFGAVDEAIADGFDEDEGFVVLGVEDDSFELVLALGQYAVEEMWLLVTCERDGPAGF